MQLQINSADRINGTPSKFTVNVPFQFTSNRFKLIYAAIPNSIYNVSLYNNTITILEGSTRVSVTIPVGYYSYPTLYTAMANALTTASTIASTYTVTTSNLLVTITSSGSFRIVYDSSPLLQYLGYPRTGTSAAAASQMAALAPALSPSQLYITLSGFSNAVYTTNQRVNATFIVPMNASIGQYNNLTEVDLFHQHAETNKKDMLSVTISVADVNGNIVALMADWSIILKCM